MSDPFLFVDDGQPFEFFDDGSPFEWQQDVEPSLLGDFGGGEAIIIAEVGIPGLPGADGAPGANGTGGGTLTAVAAGTISALKVVRVNSIGQALLASASQSSHLNLCTGISLNSATDGNPVTVRTEGEISDPGFILAAGQPVYLGLTGALTQVAPVQPTAVFRLQVGQAITANSMVVRFHPPVVLI